MRNMKYIKHNQILWEVKNNNMGKSFRRNTNDGFKRIKNIDKKKKNRKAKKIRMNEYEKISENATKFI